MPRKPRTAVATTHGLRLSRTIDTRVIYCGENLDVLKKLPDNCVDLIYIDPPFYSGRNYEILWGESWEKRAFEDRHESMTHYLRDMEERCFELQRVLRRSGSFYLHCDWHAGHHLKVMLDRVFGEKCFVNEIVWQRTSAHNDPRRYGRVHDTILYYHGGDEEGRTWNQLYDAPGENFFKSHDFVTGEDGTKNRLRDLTAPDHGKGHGQFEWKGKQPPRGRMWAYTEKNMRELDAAGRIAYSRTGMPRLKIPVKSHKGVPLQSVWARPELWLNSASKERVGYPTQKPVALLERIIKTSSNPGDIVLDAFCGCGTTLEAAEMLGRRWIGIDFSPTACRIMADRLEKKCKIRQSEALWKVDRGFILKGMPMTAETLEKMDPFDFQNWAIIAIDGYPNKKKVGDMGIDGRLIPANAIMGAGKTLGASGAQLEFTVDVWHPIQTKQVKRVGRPDIDKFETAMRRVDAHRGYFVAFGYSRDARKEIARFEREDGRVIVALTVDEILDGQDDRPRKIK